MNSSALVLFIPTFFFVSITPGMCMTLSMTLGMTIGVKRALWMMVGELIGVGLVSIAAVIGVASIMLNYPALFTTFKYIGGAYLGYLGVQMWLDRGKMALSINGAESASTDPFQLASQGLITAIANPKAWAFMVSLLPPFIDPAHALAPQLAILVSLILIIEFGCLIIYASGGRTLRQFLSHSGNVQLMNRVAGSLMIGVGIWLALG